MDKIIKQGTRVYLRTPKREEIHFIKSLWESEKYSKGISSFQNFSDDEYQSWFADKVDPGNNEERYLIIFENENDIPIGEISFSRFKSETGNSELDITVKSKYRRRGFGRESLMLLCDFYFIDFGGELLECKIEKDNAAGENMLVNFGFSKQKASEPDLVYSLKKTDYLPE